MNIGTAKATITGKGNYTGVVEKEFTIESKSATATCEFENAPYTYTGSPIEPLFAVKVGDVTIPSDQYTYELSNNTNAGTATVTIIGKSGYNYTLGTFEVNFTIAKAPLTVTVKDNTVTYGDFPKNDEANITGFVNNETEDVISGTLEYTYNYKIGDNVGEYSITPNGLSADNYQIIYVPGKLTVTPQTISSSSVEFAQLQLAYTGQPQTPEMSVYDGVRTLTAGTDYTVECIDNVDIGTAKATITGTGNYTGVVEMEFTIEPQPAAAVCEIKDDVYTYTGSPIEPLFAVKIEEDTIPSDQYTFEYSNNTNAGTAIVTIIGKSGYN